MSYFPLMWCGTEKYKPGAGTTAKPLRNADNRLLWRRQKTQQSLSTGDPVAVNNSPLKTYRPGQNQVSQVKKEQLSNIGEMHLIV